MRGVKFSLITMLALAGCDSLNKPKVDNPVMSPPPPRISFNNDADAQRVQTADAGNDIPALDEPKLTQVSLETAGNNPLSDSQTVAIVNGSPILASEVLERYGTQLADAKQKLPPEHYEQARLMLIKQDLNSHIERKLLADGLKAMLKKEQIEMLNNFINEAFEQEIARMMKEAGVNTKLELEEELRKQHTSLANLKTNFANQKMAMEYLGSKTKTDVEVGRPELLAYYNENREKYHVPARVKWQQILVDIPKHGGRQAAQARLNQIIEKLRPSQGENFAEVAQEMSDGPNAANGGRWEWTKKGSLADKRIDQALFELPAGQPSQVFESSDSFKIVKVEQREESRYKPFDELQDEIKETLEKDSRKTAALKFIEDMMAKAEITTIFDRAQPKTRLVEGTDEDDPFGLE
jgi:peptidyl-prolyl cis-trans isomerase SurA